MLIRSSPGAGPPPAESCRALSAGAAAPSCTSAHAGGRRARLPTRRATYRTGGGHGDVPECVSAVVIRTRRRRRGPGPACDPRVRAASERHGRVCDEGRHRVVWLGGQGPKGTGDSAAGLRPSGPRIRKPREGHEAFGTRTRKDASRKGENRWTSGTDSHQRRPEETAPRGDRREGFDAINACSLCVPKRSGLRAPMQSWPGSVTSDTGRDT